ncbi:MAG: hypothetical protein E7639_04680 [Ruminococcaceae bacterium]|nr:hypothetical protein [Oscillospiraceae bacterium]
MGKGNRTKKQQATDLLSGTKKRAAAKGMPTWVGTLIVVGVLVVALLACTFFALNSRGVFLRNKVIAETEHFEITVPMMSYLVYTEYQEWVNTYKDTGYMQYIKGEGGSGLNTSLPLRDQIYSSKTDETTGVTTTKTWFDMFAENAATSAEQILVLCEQAYRYGVTLNEEDYANIDNAIRMLELYAAYSGYTTSGYIASMYGRGVGEKDLRAIMEMTELATKMTDIKMDEFEAGATDVRLDKYFEENKGDLAVYVDYISYTFTSEFKVVASTEENAAAKNEEAYQKFVAEKEKMQARVDALAACTTAEEFSNLLIEYLKEDGKDATEAFNIQSEAHHINYKKTDDSSNALEKWLFGTETPVKANDTKVITTPGEPAREEGKGDGPEPTYNYSNSKATFTACFVLKPVHRDEAKLQNVGHILFKTDTFKDLKDTSKLSGKTKELAQSLLDQGKTVSAETMAKALIELMIAEGKVTTVTDSDTGRTYYRIDKEAFKEYGEAYTEDSNVFYEDVTRGQMVESFDAWLYSSDRMQDEISGTAVKTTYGYHIMFYDGASEEINWKAAAREKLTGADYEAWFKACSEATKIDVTAKNWDKID